MFIQIFQVLKEITGKIGKDIEDVNITYVLTTTTKILDKLIKSNLSLRKEYLSRKSS